MEIKECCGQIRFVPMAGNLFPTGCQEQAERKYYGLCMIRLGLTEQIR
jgi:hypothetical protein